MGRILRLLAVSLALVLIGIFLFAGGAAAQETPKIEVTVDEETVPDGGRIVIPDGTLSVTVTGTIELESVVVRIDGTDEVTASPDSSAYAVTLDQPFSARSNTVQVIVTDETGGLTTHQVTVYKDTISPRIELESPFEVSSGYQFPTSQELTNASVTITGQVHDASTITEFSARVIGGGQGIERTELTDGRFSFNTTLVPGNNSLIIEATDAYGQRSYRSTRIKVVDENDPVLTIRNWPNTTVEPTVNPTVIATDDGGVRSVTYRIPGQPERTLVEPTRKLLDAGRTNVSETPVLEFYRPGQYNVTFNATDYANGSVEVTKSIHYDPITPEERVEPEFAIDETRSGLVNNSVYRLNATVTNGSVRTVFIESEHRDEGITFFETVYDGDNTTQYRIARNISIVPGINDITVRVTDALGLEHRYPIEVNTSNATAYSPPTTASAAPNATQTTTASNGTAANTTQATTTVGVTRISVTEHTPITPRTDTSSPLSPILTVIAFGLAVLGLARRKQT